MTKPAATVCAHIAATSQGPPIIFTEGPAQGEYALSRDELLTRAAALAHRLRELGVADGDRVLTLLPTAPAFVVTLIGTWYAGAIIVPCAYGKPGQSKRPLARRLHEIIRLSNPAVIIGTEATLEVLDELPDDAERDRFQLLRDTEVMALPPSDREPPRQPRPTDPAIIQFTSGSTGGEPRGAVIRQEQLVGHVEAIRERAAVESTDSAVTWLPLYHDMGFTGGLICPLVWGLPIRLMPTESFIRNPVSWLRMFAEHGATMSAAPPFALDLLAFRLGEKRLDGVDLTTWRYVWLGSEPIFDETLRGFGERFHGRGLEVSALKPCYGLAEATLAVTLTSESSAPRSIWVDRRSLRAGDDIEPVAAHTEGAVSVVGCGTPISGVELQIRDPSGEQLEEGSPGRIAVHGSWVTSGYYGSDDCPLEDDWLDTGDLGFMLDGELYVTGREKDVIKRGGVSIQPQDVEWAASTVEGVRRGQSVAFSRYDHDKRREQIVVLVESRHKAGDKRTALVQSVRGTVTAEAGVQVDDVAIVPPGSIPRTSSGKVQRPVARRMFEDGSFAALEDE